MKKIAKEIDTSLRLEEVTSRLAVRIKMQSRAKGEEIGEDTNLSNWCFAFILWTSDPCVV